MINNFFLANGSTIINDSIYSYNYGWSSNRISNEIGDFKFKLKFGELFDVDTNNVDDNYIPSYSESTQRWVAVPSSRIGSGGDVTMNQIMKMNVKATVDNSLKFEVLFTTTTFNNLI